MPAVPINYWAVLVCGVISMVLGYIWYGALFGKTWTKLAGFDNIDPAKRAEMMKGMNKGYAISFIGSLIMAWVLAHAIVFARAYIGTQVSPGLITGFMSWLGFIAPVTLGTVLWEGKSWKLWGLTNAYQLIQLLIFGLILGSWM